MQKRSVGDSNQSDFDAEAGVQDESAREHASDLSVVGALPWHLDGHLTFAGAAPGRAAALCLWTMRVARGRALQFACREQRNSRSSHGLRPLVVHAGRPWLASALERALGRRFGLPERSGAVLCEHRGFLFMAQPSGDRSAVELHRFGAQERRSWWIARPSQGALAQLFVFGEHAALVDVPVSRSQPALHSRLLLCTLSSSEPTIRIGALSALRAPGIVNAFESDRRCVLDVVVADDDGPQRAGALRRHVFDLDTGQLDAHPSACGAVIDATVDPRRRGEPVRFIHVSHAAADGRPPGLARIDMIARASERRDVAFGQSAGALALLGGDPRALERTWIASLLHDFANDLSRLCFVPASLRGEQAAAIHLPCGTAPHGALVWSAAPPLDTFEIEIEFG
jgi:hypothetical protein